ncbi:MAG: hypothetical protein WAL85_00280 [Candidatus Korobacteraceae bacterium]
MSLKVPYKKYPTTYAECGYYYSAAIPVNIALPAISSPRSKRFEAIIDSGASSCIFHASIGRAIGLDIESGQLTETLGVAGAMAIYLHDISLYAPGGIITTRAGFSDNLPIAGLLGMAGFFENYKISFDPVTLRCELERIYQA